MDKNADVRNANLPEMDDTEFANGLCLEMFNKAISEYNPDDLTASKEFLRINNIAQDSPLFYLFTGFEMGMAAALDIVNNEAEAED